MKRLAEYADLAVTVVMAGVYLLAILGVLRCRGVLVWSSAPNSKRETTTDA